MYKNESPAPALRYWTPQPISPHMPTAPPFRDQTPLQWESSTWPAPRPSLKTLPSMLAGRAGPRPQWYAGRECSKCDTKVQETECWEQSKNIFSISQGGGGAIDTFPSKEDPLLKSSVWRKAWKERRGCGKERKAEKEIKMKKVIWKKYKWKKNSYYFIILLPPPPPKKNNNYCIVAHKALNQRPCPEL